MFFRLADEKEITIKGFVDFIGVSTFLTFGSSYFIFNKGLLGDKFAQELETFILFSIGLISARRNPNLCFAGWIPSLNADFGSVILFEDKFSTFTDGEGGIYSTFFDASIRLSAEDIGVFKLNDDEDLMALIENHRLRETLGRIAPSDEQQEGYQYFRVRQS